MLNENMKAIRKSKGLSQEELAVAGVAFHAFEWLFVRLAPLFLIGAILGMFLIKKKK